jgi:hypothetical protein
MTPIESAAIAYVKALDSGPRIAEVKARNKLKLVVKLVSVDAKRGRGT